MALLPGVPNVGPAPVQVAPHSSSAVGIGKQTGIAKIAAGAGKPHNTQHLGNLTSPSPRATPRTSLTPGNPGARKLGQYGKAPGLVGGGQGDGDTDVTQHPGAKMVRGGMGGIKPHVREGGLGPGKMSTPGPSNTDYSMQNMDTE